jgi:hypothetical protein
MPSYDGYTVIILVNFRSPEGGASFFMLSVVSQSRLDVV